MTQFKHVLSLEEDGHNQAGTIAKDYGSCVRGVENLEEQGKEVAKGMNEQEGVHIDVCFLEKTVTDISQDCVFLDSF